MKKTQEILGLPIISISDGLEAGIVKGIIINSEKGAIDYIVVDSGIQFFGVRVMPAKAVLGIGAQALTIEDASTIAELNKVPEAIELLQKEVGVTGTGVLTKKGRMIGEIGDFYVDEDNNCVIAGLEFKGSGAASSIKLIPRESVITFGKKLTVVQEDVESRLLDTPDELGFDGNEMLFGAGSSFKAPEIRSLIDVDEIISQNAQDDIKENVKFTEIESDQEDDGSAAILFEQRQRQYLMGRKATKTITDNSGTVIISEGEVIDDSIIDDAKGKGKLIELVMNNRA